jgi:hypothetical protein
MAFIKETNSKPTNVGEDGEWKGLYTVVGM